MKDIEKGKLKLNTEDDTRTLGLRIAEAAEPGDVVALIGDLGTGKTALTRYIAEGLGVCEQISSPTFTIERNTKAGGCRSTTSMYTDWKAEKSSWIQVPKTCWTETDCA